MKQRMNGIKATWRNECFETWMIIWFTLYQTTTIPKWMVSQIFFFFKSTLQLNGKYCTAFQFVPQPTAMTFAFCSVFILLRWKALFSPAIGWLVKKNHQFVREKDWQDEENGLRKPGGLPKSMVQLIGCQLESVFVLSDHICIQGMQPSIGKCLDWLISFGQIVCTSHCIKSFNIKH